MRDYDITACTSCETERALSDIDSPVESAAINAMPRQVIAEAKTIQSKATESKKLVWVVWSNFTGFILVPPKGDLVKACAKNAVPASRSQMREM